MAYAGGRRKLSRPHTQKGKKKVKREERKGKGEKRKMRKETKIAENREKTRKFYTI